MEFIPKKFSDIVIIVEGKEYYLHKVILNVIPYFKKLFMYDKENTITMEENVSRDSFEKIIRQVYTSMFEKVVLDIEIDDLDTASYLGFENAVDETIDYVIGKVRESSSRRVTVKPKELELYIAKVEEIDPRFINTSYIKRVLDKEDITNYPHIFYYYQAISKNPDTNYDLTDIYNYVFDTDIKHISFEDAIERFKQKKLK